MGNNMKITELDRYLFGQGTHYEIYKLLGAIPELREKKREFSSQCGLPTQRAFL